MMNKLALYVFPLGVVVGGPFLPLAIIMYWVANNIWTFGQQHYVFGKIEKEEEAEEARGASSAARPTRRRPAPSRIARSKAAADRSADAGRGRRGARGDGRTRDAGERVDETAADRRRRPVEPTQEPSKPAARNGAAEPHPAARRAAEEAKTLTAGDRDAQQR